MAKGGKGRKGGGGGGGKTRKYSRDNNGRFASTGTGATARGGRLLTAKGNKRTARALAGKTKTIEAKGQKGVLAKPKGLKPNSLAANVKPKPTKTTSFRPGTKRYIFSPESKKLSGLYLNATDASLKINLPGKYGGKGALYKTKEGKAAKAKAIAATKALRAEQARAGLPKSGGAMRVKGGIKRDPNAVSKLKARKPSAAKRAVLNTVPSNKPKRVLVKANARPENLFSRATKKTPGYGTDAKANIANARKRIEEKGIKTALKSNKRSGTVASVSSKTPNQINFNASHPSWKNPRKSSIDDRRKNWLSTAKAGHVPAHELGHIKHSPDKLAGSWDVQLRGKGQIYADADKVVATQRLATRVSKYARTSPGEFTAETRAALSLGKKYDSKVMRLYRSTTGVKLPSVKSQLRAQGVKGAFVSPRVKSKPARKPRPMR